MRTFLYAHGYAMLALGQSGCKATYLQDVDGQKKAIFEELIN
jgi:hypothetical protein